LADNIDRRKHYIPLSTAYAELYNIRTFFSGFPTALTALNSFTSTVLTKPHPVPELPTTSTGESFDGDRALQDIAEAGRDWRQNHVRKGDMEVSRLESTGSSSQSSFQLTMLSSPVLRVQVGLALTDMHTSSLTSSPCSRVVLQINDRVSPASPSSRSIPFLTRLSQMGRNDHPDLIMYPQHRYDILTRPSTATVTTKESKNPTTLVSSEDPLTLQTGLDATIVYVHIPATSASK
jgi:hypothetical protein